MSREPHERALQDALRLLAGRDYTRKALEQKLLARGFEAPDAESAASRCEELGYVDDRAYGLSRARSSLHQRPCGRTALSRDLQRRGLARTMSEEIVKEAYAEAGGDASVLAAALQLWIARHGEPEDWKAARRCADHLARRGFPPAAARAVLQPWLDRLSS